MRQSRDMLNLVLYLDEDIPYLQYPSKQQQQQQPPPPPPPPQQQHVDESTSTTNVVEVSAPLVVKLPGDEPLPPPTLVVSHPQPIVPAPPLSDPFDFFNTLMTDVPLGDLDWLNIESEENIRPRKRQNIITISRMSSKYLFI